MHIMPRQEAGRGCYLFRGVGQVRGGHGDCPLGFVLRWGYRAPQAAQVEQQDLLECFLGHLFCLLVLGCFVVRVLGRLKPAIRAKAAPCFAH